MDLAEKMRKAREIRVEIDTFVFTIRRPTDLQMIKFAKGYQPIDFMPYIVDWENFKEIDLIAGGVPEAVAFNQEVAFEWLSDQPKIFNKLMSEIMAAYTNRQVELAAAKKN